MSLVSVERRRVLRRMRSVYSARFSSSSPRFCSSVAYPSMADSGVLNSWETFSTKSMRKSSVPASSRVMMLKWCAMSCSSAMRKSSLMRTLKSPRATAWAASRKETMAAMGARLANRASTVPTKTLAMAIASTSTRGRRLSMSPI